MPMSEKSLRMPMKVINLNVYGFECLCESDYGFERYEGNGSEHLR